MTIPAPGDATRSGPHYDRRLPVFDNLDGAALARVVATYRDALRAHQRELNRLNVYPVPDGDTGTNMALTLESVCAELGDAHRMDDVCQAVAHGSLMGARGNSGVYLFQILRTRRHLPSLGVGVGRHPGRGAAPGVRRRVPGRDATRRRHDPHRGARLGGGGRGGPGRGEARLDGLLDRVHDAALDAVDRSPELLPVLKEAGVVDAGGRGFTLLVDAFLHVVDGRPLPEPEVVATPAAVAAHQRGESAAGLRYEVMFLLDADDATIPAFKEAWDSIGDSIVVVGGDGTWNCHVHTNEIGAAIEVGIEAGRPSKIRVTDLVEQVEEERWVRDAAGGPGDGAVDVPVTTAVVVVAVGTGSAGCSAASACRRSWPAASR